MLEAAIVTAASVLFVYWWIGFKLITRIGLIVDLLTFVGLTWMFHGTYIGMMTGASAALIVSIVLRGMRWYYKHQPRVITQ